MSNVAYLLARAGRDVWVRQLEARREHHGKMRDKLEPQFADISEKLAHHNQEWNHLTEQLKKLKPEVYA